MIPIVLAVSVAVAIFAAPFVIPAVERAMTGTNLVLALTQSISSVDGLDSWASYYSRHALGDIPLIALLALLTFAILLIAIAVSRNSNNRESESGVLGRQSVERSIKAILRKCFTWNGGKPEHAGFVVGHARGRYVVTPATHVCYFAPSGVGKTRALCLPGITCCAMSGDMNIVVTDPSREIYCQTRRMLEKLGYEVILLDFEDAHAGDRYDPLRPVVAMHRQAADHLAEERSDEIGATIFPETKTEGDAFSRPAAGLLSGICYYVATSDEVPEESRNFATAVRVVLEGTTGGDSAAFKEWLRSFPPDGPVRSFCAPYLAASDRYETSIAGTLATGLRPFTTGSMRYMTSGGGVDFERLLKSPTALFLHTAQPGMPANKAASLAIAQLFAVTVREGQRRGSTRKTAYFLDEAHSVADGIPLVAMLETGRKFGVKVALFYQSIAGLGKESREAVLANCDAKVCARAGDVETASYFEQLGGKSTIWAVNEGSSRSPKGGSSSSGRSERERSVWMAGDLLQRDPAREGVALFQNPTGHPKMAGKFEVPIEEISKVPFMRKLLGTIGNREYEELIISEEIDRLENIARRSACDQDRDTWVPDFGGVSRGEDDDCSDDADIFGL